MLIDEQYAPISLGSDLEQLQSILVDYVEVSAENKDQDPKVWLSESMQKSLPDKSKEEIDSYVDEIITSLDTAEDNKKSLDDAISHSRSSESWFASKVRDAVSTLSTNEQVKYLEGLDRAVSEANLKLEDTIRTQSGTISQNPNLDGYIAEQYHAQTFNMNAQAAGSLDRAEVIEPQGAYNKNGVDIQVKDADGNVVHRYQSKYCKDPQATQSAFESGDYRGQQSLVPEGQEVSIKRKTTTVIENADGSVTSNPLTKERAMQMRDEAQSGKFNDLNWNEYKTKDIAIGIGKNAAKAGLQGMAISAGMDIAKKLYNGEEIKGEEVVKTALEGGADYALKSATAGALKVASEKGIIGLIPKGTPAGTIANIAFVAVEDVKIVNKMVNGELTIEEGIDHIGRTTVSTTAGLLTMGEGAAIGAAIGTCLGPIGTAVGSFIGGTLGYIGGSKVGEALYNGAKKIGNAVCNVVKTVGSAVVDFVDDCISAIGGFFASLF